MAIPSCYKSVRFELIASLLEADFISAADIGSRRSVRVPFGLRADCQPIHGARTLRAKISPKPSITPLTKGRNMLMAMEEMRARVRVLTVRVVSRMRGVTEGG